MSGTQPPSGRLFCWRTLLQFNCWMLLSLTVEGIVAIYHAHTVHEAVKGAIALVGKWLDARSKTKD
jgi:hypothetical protein